MNRNCPAFLFVILAAALGASGADVSHAVVHITPVTRNSTAAAQALPVAREKKALLPIVIAPTASESTKTLAAELATDLEKISGAKFSVITGNGSTGIVVGQLAEFPATALDAPLEMFGPYDGREAYAIRTQPKRLLLIGRTELGTSHAVFRFLREVGCRWFFPDKAWEVIPQIADLHIDRDITDRPTLLSRSIWFEAGSGGNEQNTDYANWKRHNAQAESFVVHAGHNLFSVIAANQAAFDQHPEYYALMGGKRTGPQIELGNPVVRKMVVDYAIDYFKKNPNDDMVSLEPADTITYSESPESQALGTPSDQIFGIANEVAAALQRACPGKMVGVLAYNSHWEPPKFNMEPNVHVQLTSAGQGSVSSAEREALWPQRCHNIGIYEYFSIWLFGHDLLLGSWANDVHGIQSHFRTLVANGGTSVSAESTSAWGPNGRGYYVANALIWNPEIDVDALTKDFYEKAFGPAAEPMRHYFERLDPDTRPFLSKHLLALAYRDIEEADHLSAGRLDVQARLDQLKQYLRYVQLEWMRDRTPGTDAQKKQLSEQIMRNLYRTRFAALTAWEMTRQNWGNNHYPPVHALDAIPTPARGPADELDNDGPKKPVLEDLYPPYTHEETEKEFREGLNFFQPSRIGPAVKFSDDLVPVKWADSPAIKSEQAYQGGVQYMLYSLHGEPLEFTTAAGNAWGGINRFKATDAAGKELASGRLPNDKTTIHKIEVPAAGLYKLDYDDHGSYWTMTVEPGRAATIPMGQAQDYRNSRVMQDMYFYVPRGTKQIDYFYTRTAYHPGGPHQVIDPTGKVAKAVDVNGDWVNISVPEGADGKLWHFHDPVLGLFFFNNIPNNIAASPDALLIPRELIAKDQLELRK